MKYIGENAIKKLISLIKGDLAKKQNSITVSGLLKGNGTTISAAVAGTDYMAPVTGGTAGQVLTKTADGQEWQDREKDLFVVNMTMNDSGIPSADKTFDEVCAAYNTGKTVIADLYLSQNDLHYILPSVLLKIDQGIKFAAVNRRNSIAILMKPTDIVIQNMEIQDQIIATGLLKGDGNGGVSAAVAGTDYVAPDGNGSNVTAAFTAATTRANIATGEKLSVLFGKISKWFSDLGSLAFKSTVAKSDLASDVQTSLGKADSALQNYTETDPTVPAWAKSKTKPTYTASEVGAVPTSRTVNGKALSANITLAASDVGAATMNEVNSAIQTAIGNAIGGSY